MKNVSRVSGISMNVLHTINLHYNAILTRPNVIRKDPHYTFALIEADKDDNKFVDCAIAANAKCIVTEDKHFKVLENVPFPKVEVIGIEDFKCYLDKWI